MKKHFYITMLGVSAATFTMGITSCSSDDDNYEGGETTEQVESIRDITSQYLNSVVYPTYTSLANETSHLYEYLDNAKAALRDGTLTQSDIDRICTSFLNARSYWEKTEAFLYGPATTFGIDPHIDTWPLDLNGLAVSLSNKQQIQMLDDGDNGISYAGAKLGQELLGFHGIEFIIFRNGSNRTLSSLKGVEDDPAFTGKNVTGEEELVYATAVAGDLRDRCFQLEVAWRGKSASQSHLDRVEECELETQIGTSYYGDNMLGATKAGSTFATWQEVLITIFESGCSNIANEVANTKMGNAYTGEDPNYIESPYSKKSFVDFYDNIISIRNSLYGGLDLGTPHEHSAMTLLKEMNPDLATKIESSLNSSLDALKECQKGTAFVDAPQSPKVKVAMDAINELDANLKAAAQWSAGLR